MIARVIIILILTAAASAPSFAQTDRRTIAPEEYGTGAGLQVLLTNSGFGLGGYYARAISGSASLLFETSLGSGKDEREARYFRYGSTFVPGKASYLLMIPIQGGLTLRLFREEIEDNFRPYVQMTAGPTIGWQSPYFDDCNGNGNLDDAVDCTGDGEATDSERTFGIFRSLPKGDVKMGAGATIAIGAFFGERRRTTQGIRLGYSLNYFFDAIQLLEREYEPVPRRWIGSPTITLTFGRLLAGPDEEAAKR